MPKRILVIVDVTNRILCTETVELPEHSHLILKAIRA